LTGAGEEGRGEVVAMVRGGADVALAFFASLSLHPELPPNAPGRYLATAGLGLSARGGVPEFVARVGVGGTELTGVTRLHAEGSPPFVARFAGLAAEGRGFRNAAALSAAFSAARVRLRASASSSRCARSRACSKAAARSDSRCFRRAAAFSSASRFWASAAARADSSSAR